MNTNTSSATNLANWDEKKVESLFFFWTQSSLNHNHWRSRQKHFVLLWTQITLNAKQSWLELCFALSREDYETIWRRRWSNNNWSQNCSCQKKEFCPSTSIFNAFSSISFNLNENIILSGNVIFLCVSKTKQKRNSETNF